MTEIKWESESIRYIDDHQQIPIHSDDQVTVLAPNVVTAYDDHQQVYTAVNDDSKTGGTTYQLWKLEPPVQSHNAEIIVQSQSGQSGSTVIEDIGAHENDFDMMLYDEPSGGQDNQNDIVHTDKVVVNGWQEGKWYYCGTCGMRFRTERGLFDHDSATHQGIKPYKCSKCGMGFKDQWKLKTHQIVHTDHKPFTCSICSKGFRTKFNLQRHEKTHRKKMKTTSCEPKSSVSPLRTPTTCSLVSSPINHFGHSTQVESDRQIDIAAIENSVVDEEVVKIERDPDDQSESSLDSSTRVILPSSHHHRRITPNNSAAAAQNNYRYKPMRPRSPGELTCKICGKMFKTVSYLKEHQIVHSDEQPFQCEKCLTRFKRKQDFVKHQRRHHH